MSQSVAGSDYSLWELFQALIHSVTQGPGYFYSASSGHYYSEALSTQHGSILCLSFTPKRRRQLRVKNLPKVPTWRLERKSNPRPFGRKVPNQFATTPRLICHRHTMWGCISRRNHPILHSLDLTLAPEIST